MYEAISHGITVFMTSCFPKFWHFIDARYRKSVQPTTSILGAVWLHFFHHLSLITHHLSLNCSHPFGIITQFPSFNIFHTICGLIPISRYSFFFFFSFQYPNSPKLIYIYIYIQIYRYKPNEQPTQEKRKSKLVKSCGWYCLRVPHVCLITKMSLSYELWKLKTAKMCFQFP